MPFRRKTSFRWILLKGVQWGLHRLKKNGYLIKIYSFLAQWPIVLFIENPKQFSSGKRLQAPSGMEITAGYDGILPGGR